jgi:phosphotransferase family enzyme
MSRHAVIEVLPADPGEHRAVMAWRQARPGQPVPQKIEILKVKRRKSAVYRLIGTDSGGSAVIAKRCPARTASVERSFYSEILTRLPVPALRCYGFHREPGGEFCWLFLEDAGSTEYSPDLAGHRALAGRWLGAVHRAALKHDLPSSLPRRDLEHYSALLWSARRLLLKHRDSPILAPEDSAVLRGVLGHYELIERHWPEMKRFYANRPQTLVHGDFVIKNLRIHEGPAGQGLLVYDWEMAGWGVPGADLAQDIGRCAKPDLSAYSDELGALTGGSGTDDLLRLAQYGSVLRLIDMVYWATTDWMRELGPEDTRWFLLKPIATLRKYETRLSDALHALSWRQGD